MKNFTRNIVVLLLLATIFFVFKDSIEKSYFGFKYKLFPCSSPIKYSIGYFDERFGISKDEFLSSIQLAEKVWEDSVDRDLFSYSTEGDLKINLKYDTRQETTEKLNTLDSQLGTDSQSYESSKDEYNILYSNYLQEKKDLEIKIKIFQERQKKYESNVNYWNGRGGAPENEYNSLNQEKTYLENEIEKINNAQTVLVEKINSINSLANQLNEVASNLNISTEKYNNIRDTLGDEFEEGIYYDDGLNRGIDIYQFSDDNNLIRLLTHELGHALSLEHAENPSAIMYRVNIGGDYTLSEEDISMLKGHCKIK
ncbi:MAG TPA: matrixin family metalloprotease [Candidatus Paceibacterota bacterium]|nr:matrixin family metalloprotease [Candidatus Paceibacterota bacterium]HPT17856.1 matrixin family metalloprotease [Candidatus Paceibacterota bacterium]